MYHIIGPIQYYRTYNIGHFRLEIRHWKLEVGRKLPRTVSFRYHRCMSPDEIREDIELQIVELIKNLLAAGTITEERAGVLSDHTLKVLIPGMTLEELYRAIPKLDDTASELAPVVLPFLRQYEEGITKQAQQNVEELIRQGQYDAAVSLGQKAIDKSVDLVWQGAGSPDPALSAVEGQGAGTPDPKP